MHAPVRLLTCFLPFWAVWRATSRSPLGAWGGIFLGGGILPRLGNRIDSSVFRERFEGKGRFENHLKPVPVWVIEARQSPALLGASKKLDMAASG